VDENQGKTLPPVAVGQCFSADVLRLSDFALWLLWGVDYNMSSYRTGGGMGDGCVDGGVGAAGKGWGSSPPGPGMTSLGSVPVI